MIDLYAAGTSNGLRARMALEECGLAYNLHPIALDRGEQKSAQFLAMNPNGQIPVIVDSEGPDGKRVTVTQSGAILLYCAEKSGRFIPKDPAARVAMWEALMSAATDVTPTLGAVFTIVRSKEPHGPSATLFKERFRQYMRVWEQKLAMQNHVAGDEMTIADISLYASYVRAKAGAPDLCEPLPCVERWASEMGARPAMQRAVKW